MQVSMPQQRMLSMSSTQDLARSFLPLCSIHMDKSSIFPTPNPAFFGIKMPSMYHRTAKCSPPLKSYQMKLADFELLQTTAMNSPHSEQQANSAGGVTGVLPDRSSSARGNVGRIFVTSGHACLPQCLQWVIAGMMI
jgi:hypothetical protein